MIPPHFYSPRVVLGLLWLCVMLHLAWASPGTTPQTQSSAPITPRRKRANAPTPFAGLTHQPPCPLGEQAAAHPYASPPAPPHRCPRPPDVRVQSIPRGTFVPIRAVAIAAGPGGAISVPTAIPAVAHGANSTGPPATATFRSMCATKWHRRMEESLWSSQVINEPLGLSYGGRSPW
jgi:hypothetical protein